MKSVITTVKPAVLPLPLEDMKLHARVCNDVEDNLINRLIAAATDRAQAITARQLVEATKQLRMFDFPCDCCKIELPSPPLQSVSSIEYRDIDGTWQTLDPSVYLVETAGGGTTPQDITGVGYVMLKEDQDWPDTFDEEDINVRITYVCGYPLENGIATTPEAIKTWIAMQAATQYKVRSSLFIGTIVSKVPKNMVNGNLMPYRVDFKL